MQCCLSYLSPLAIKLRISSLSHTSVCCPRLWATARRGCGALRQLALQCRSLRSVDATFCGSLNDEALAAAVRGLPSLRTLLLAVCPDSGRCLTCSLRTISQQGHV